MGRAVVYVQWESRRERQYRGDEGPPWVEVHRRRGPRKQAAAENDDDGWLVGSEGKAARVAIAIETSRGAVVESIVERGLHE